MIAEPSLAALLRGPLTAIGLGGAASTVATILGVAVSMVVLMVVGELVPKNWAIARPLAVATVVATPQRGFTAHFFEENTPRVFGLAFDDIDLAEVVQHDRTRAHLKTAAQLDSQGSRLEAMGTLAVAFEDLMDAQIHDEDAPRRMSVYSFGRRLPAHIPPTKDVRAILREPDHASRRGVPPRGADRLADEYTQIRDVTRALQEGMRLMVLGVDFHQYQRFTQLTPSVGYYGNSPEPRFSVEAGYAPNQEEFDFCRQFVTTVALRLTEINARAVPPSWK
jgi:hypothetical protein